MKKSASLNLLAETGIQFSNVNFLVEIFPSPIPENINNTVIESVSDLFRMSAHEGYEELFIPTAEGLHGDSGGKKYEFSRTDFIKWQLTRFSEKTIFQLINKTDCDVTTLLDDDVEYEKDPDYAPDTWLNPYENGPFNFEKGLMYITRLRSEVPEEFYAKLIDSILDPDYGVLEHFETELNDNIIEVRQMYAEWEVPLMIVSKGSFFPYIEPGYDINLMMDDFRLQRMYVRNHDEGDIAGGIPQNQ